MPPPGRMLFSMVVSWLFASRAVAFSPSSTLPLQISRGGLTTLHAGPPVPPKPVGIYMHGVAKPTLVIETYLDFCCPFSRKIFDCLYGDVMPPLMAAGQVDWLFQCVPQPWHPQSSYMHEVALAVKLVDESKFMPAASALFAAQSQFYDDATADKTRNQIYDDLVAVVAAAMPSLDSEAVRGLVALKGTGNEGNRVTQEMKWAVKYHRTRSVHVTPTVFLNGLEAPDISSSWGLDEWNEKITCFLNQSGA